MRVINERSREVLLTELKEADTFLKRFMGLMFKKGLPSGTGLKIEPCSSIHTFNMKFPIDVLFVSKDHRVLKVITEMKPGKVSAVVKASRYVIEANENEFAGKASVGDLLNFE